MEDFIKNIHVISNADLSAEKSQKISRRTSCSLEMTQEGATNA